jgi:hypothetical protein
MKIFIVKTSNSLFKHTSGLRKVNYGRKELLFISSCQFSKKEYKFDTETNKFKLNYLNTEDEQANLPILKDNSKEDKTSLLFEEAKMYKRDDNKTAHENLLAFREHIRQEHIKYMEKAYHKGKIGLGLLVLLIGLFSLWVPLYRVICESQGFSVKTKHTDYKFDGKECNIY